MRAVVASESRFHRTPDGAVWSPVLSPGAFDPQLRVFDEVRVVARVWDDAAAAAGWRRVDSARVSFCAVPGYAGAAGFLSNRQRVRRAVFEAASDESSAYFIKGGSPLSSLVESALVRRGQPFGVEVVGDPRDVFAPGTINHPLRPLLRWHFARELRRQCRRAAATNYVTEAALQRRYPPAAGAFTGACSDVQLPPEAFAAAERHPWAGGRPAELIMVGSLAQMYKAPDVLIDAVARCVSGGLDLRLSMIGDGKFRPDLERRAAAAGLGERVRFLGQLPAGQAVRERLDRADLFVLPSRTEGLPRAMVEAMARGLPCVGSTVGGIPELLPPEDLVPPGDAEALAGKIREVLTQPGRLAAMSRRNLQRAADFRPEVLDEKYQAFLRHVRDATAAWRESRRRR